MKKLSVQNLSELSAEDEFSKKVEEVKKQERQEETIKPRSYSLSDKDAKYVDSIALSLSMEWQKPVNKSQSLRHIIDFYRKSNS